MKDHPLVGHRIPYVSDAHIVRWALGDATITDVHHYLSVRDGIDRLTLTLERGGESLGSVVIHAERLHLELSVGDENHYEGGH